MNPRFPVYIVSKGRWESRLTSRALEFMGVPYYIVVEEQEYSEYISVIEQSKVIVLDKQYQRDYDTYDNLGGSKSKGPGPARNFIWDYSIAAGASWHWVMDDNITGFWRMNRNMRYLVKSGGIFRAMEDFCLRYKNVAMAGPNYEHFAPRKEKLRPVTLNTRIYSCNLIRNDIPYRWRGRYNEDTDLSLRILKDGWCTVLFNAFLQDKLTTQTIGGGCTKEFYVHEGTLPKSAIQVKMHPDVSRLVWRWGRWHHYVDYSPFKRNKLVKRKDVDIPAGVKNYGMVLVDEGEPRTKPW